MAAKIYNLSNFRRGGRNMSNLSNKKHLEFLEGLAQEKLDDHGVVEIPVDPLVIAAIEGIEVFETDFAETDVSGLIKKNGEDVSIYVNSYDVPVRKRFTIAHELGHLFLHLQNEDGNFIDNKISLFRSSEIRNTSDALREVEANHFAAALLMPKSFVSQEWKKTRSVASIAKLFNVSAGAMENRLKYLGLR